MKIGSKLVLIALAIACMAPNRREFDHIGNVHFTVEISGVNAGAFAHASGLSSALAGHADQTLMFGGRIGDAPAQTSTGGAATVKLELVRSDSELPVGYTCAIKVKVQTVGANESRLALKPVGPPSDDCQALRQALR